MAQPARRGTVVERRRETKVKKFAVIAVIAAIGITAGVVAVRKAM